MVFSDETLGGIENADAAFYERLSKDFAIWDDIDVHYRGEILTSGGHGFAAISRQRLLGILRERCEEFGVNIHYRQPSPPVEQLCGSFDLVVGAEFWDADVLRPVREALESADFRREVEALGGYDTSRMGEVLAGG